MPYQPFAIADYKKGRESRRQAWISPADSFAEVRNGYVFRGRISKRPGYTVFGRLAQQQLSPPDVLAGSLGDASPSSSSYPLAETGLRPATSLRDWEFGAGPPFAAPYRIAMKFRSTSDYVYDDGQGNLVRHRSEATGGGSFSLFGLQVVGSFGAQIIPGSVRLADTGPTNVEIFFDEGENPSGNYDEAKPWSFNAVTGAISIYCDNGPFGAVVVEAYEKIGTIDYETGEYEITTPFWLASNIDHQWWYEYRALQLTTQPSGAAVAEAQNAVMAIRNFFPSSGSEVLLAFDRRKFWRWSAANLEFEFVSGLEKDIYSCEPWDFHDFAAFEEDLVIANGVDPVTFYDNSDGEIKEVHIDWTNPEDVPLPISDAGWASFNSAPPGAYSRSVDTAQFAVRYKERLVLLGTRESGTYHGRRARWSRVSPTLRAEAPASGLPGDWNVSDWTDATTEDNIVGHAFFRNELYVFFERSVWVLEFREDPRLPFVWRHISTGSGGRARMGTVTEERKLVAVSDTALIETKGNEVMPSSEQIPDVVLEWDTSRVLLSFADRLREFRQRWITYTKPEEVYPQHILTINYEEETVSSYDIPIHCFGRFNQATSLLWDDLVEAWNSYEISWDQYLSSAGFPLALLGNRELEVLHFGASQQDDGMDFAFELLTQRINPFMSQGVPKSARLGWIDLVASRADGVELEFQFMRDFSDAVYMTKRVPLSGVTGSDQVFRRIIVNRCSRYHRFRIKEVGGRGFSIDGLVLWMQPDGNLRETTR